MARKELEAAVEAFVKLARAATGSRNTSADLSTEMEEIDPDKDLDRYFDLQEEEIEQDEILSKASLFLGDVVEDLTFAELRDLIVALAFNFGDTATEEGESRIQRLWIFIKMMLRDQPDDDGSDVLPGLDGLDDEPDEE